MGACLSRKNHSSSSSSLNNVSLSAVIESVEEDLPELKINKKLATQEDDKEKVKKQVAEEGSSVKKEIFVIKHRKSHDRERPSVSKEEENMVSSSISPPASSAITNIAENGSNVVVRTSSCTKEEVDAILIQCGRLSRSNSSGTPAIKPSNSGKKYAGSKRSFDLDSDQEADYEENDGEIGADTRYHRQRHRQSGGRQAHSSPSQGRRRTPSRERDKEHRSGSRERGNCSSTTSSGRRVSRSPNRRSETTPNPNSSSTTTRPGKMVSVPATVANGIESQTANGIKRVSVKRNVGEGAGPRAAASPRSQSPARAQSPGRLNARGGSNLNSIENNQPTLSRSNSRKAEQSPYRRNPLSEIDPNCLVYAQTTANNNKANNGSNKVVNQAQSMPQTLTRTRSARRSRDFDFNPETITNPNPSYTALLLEDIQNFHQKNTNTTNTSFPVPACLTKACSILEAVADLNSTTSSNLSCTVGKKLADEKDPFVESEVGVRDDLMEPSLHKYVTVRRGGDDLDGQESSGSNSIVGGSSNQHWGYSRDPNSADSTDGWGSRSNTREDDERSPLGFHKCLISENIEEARRGFSGERTGIGRRAAAST